MILMIPKKKNRIPGGKLVVLFLLSFCFWTELSCHDCFSFLTTTLIFRHISVLFSIHHTLIKLASERCIHSFIFLFSFH